MISWKAASLAILVASYPIVVPALRDVAEIAAFFRKASSISRSNGKQPKVSSDPTYVALGSSFAAGPGAGDFLVRSIGKSQGTEGYPFQLARKIGLSSERFVNASSSGELLACIKDKQVGYITETTKLVTITAGGNDVNYSRDFLLCALKKRLQSWVVRFILSVVFPLEEASARDFDSISANFDTLCHAIRKISPQSIIVIVSYIAILPPKGVLTPLTEQESEVLREVARRLFLYTAEAAKRNSCVLVDMTTPSQIHHADSDSPWATGFDDLVPVHPNADGHTACAEDTYACLSESGLLPEIE